MHATFHQRLQQVVAGSARDFAEKIAVPFDWGSRWCICDEEFQVSQACLFPTRLEPTARCAVGLL